MTGKSNQRVRVVTWKGCLIINSGGFLQKKSVSMPCYVWIIFQIPLKGYYTPFHQS